MKNITVEDLLKYCQNQVKKGNGKKVIMISRDDEGNGYHYLWYSFSTVEEAGAEDFIDERCASKENTIILG